MKQRVTLNRKEQKRLIVLNQVEAGYTTAGEVAETLSLSLCHVRRLLGAYKKEGAAAFSTWQPGEKALQCLG